MQDKCLMRHRLVCRQSQADGSAGNSPVRCLFSGGEEAPPEEGGSAVPLWQGWPEFIRPTSGCLSVASGAPTWIRRKRLPLHWDCPWRKWWRKPRINRGGWRESGVNNWRHFCHGNSANQDFAPRAVMGQKVGSPISQPPVWGFVAPSVLPVTYICLRRSRSSQNQVLKVRFAFRSHLARLK